MDKNNEIDIDLQIKEQQDLNAYYAEIYAEIQTENYEAIYGEL